MKRYLLCQYVAGITPSRLLTRGQAIAELMSLGYTRREANQVLDEPDEYKRAEISLRVQRRLKGY